MSDVIMFPLSCVFFSLCGLTAPPGDLAPPAVHLHQLTLTQQTSGQDISTLSAQRYVTT